MILHVYSVSIDIYVVVYKMSMGICRLNGEPYTLSGICSKYIPKHPLLDGKYSPDHNDYPKVCGNCKYWILTKV